MGFRNTSDYLLGATPGDAVVLVDGDHRHTYGELRATVATLTNRLRARELSTPFGEDDLPLRRADIGHRGLTAGGLE